MQGKKILNITTFFYSRMPLYVKKDKILDKNVSEILNLRKLPCTTRQLFLLQKKKIHAHVLFFHNLKKCFKKTV